MRSMSSTTKKVIDLTFSPSIENEEIKRLLTWCDESITSARIQLDKIRNDAKKMRKRDQDGCRDFSQDTTHIENTDFRNIIAFTGDRGTGKTTAMRLFLGCLGDFQKTGISDIEKYLFTPSDCYGRFAETMPIIDPSKMSEGEGEGILAYLVSSIYEKIRHIAEKHPECFGKSANKYRDLANECGKLFRKIRTKTIPLKESVSAFSNDRDYLEDFASLSQLKISIYKLVAEYLELRKTEFLVIPIDDLDTNTRGGFDIARELQHYLSLPNIVILMAVKVEQLSDLIEQRYIDEHKEILNRNMKLDSDPAEMAVKFLQKLIPASQRIQMSQLRLHTLRDVEVSYGKTDSKPLTDEFLRLIYLTTGIILTKDSNKAHPLIPLNLNPNLHSGAINAALLRGVQVIIPCFRF